MLYPVVYNVECEGVVVSATAVGAPHISQTGAQQAKCDGFVILGIASTRMLKVVRGPCTKSPHSGTGMLRGRAVIEGLRDVASLSYTSSPLPLG